jgi:uncharacterized phiE125 gp8 family phage protein
MIYQRTLVLIEGPSVPVVTADELRTMLSVTTEDDVLEPLEQAAVATLDPASNGWLGRALRPQTWELRLSQFPCDAIRLPFPPQTSIVSFKYDDAAGVEQTLVEGTDYRVFNLNQRVACLVDKPYQGSWPSARYDRESIRIRYVAGYAGNAMPAPIKQAVALAVKDLQSISERNLFLNREEIPGVRSRGWVVSESAGKVIQNAIGNLLSTYRVWSNG